MAALLECDLSTFGRGWLTRRAMIPFIAYICPRGGSRAVPQLAGAILLHLRSRLRFWCSKSVSVGVTVGLWLRRLLVPAGLSHNSLRGGPWCCQKLAESGREAGGMHGRLGLTCETQRIRVHVWNRKLVSRLLARHT